MTGMSAGIETVDLIEPWIYATLSGDPELLALVNGIEGVSGTLSPTELRVPYVTFMLDSPRDIRGIGGHIISVDALYLIKAVGATSSWDDLLPIVARIKQLLHRPNEVVMVPGGSLTCLRERIVQYPEELKSVQYRHLGALWRIRASYDT